MFQIESSDELKKYINIYLITRYKEYEMKKCMAVDLPEKKKENEKILKLKTF